MSGRHGFKEPVRRAAALVILLGAATVSPPLRGELAPPQGGDLDAARASLDAGYREQLEQLAAKCDELELQQQARITRAWFVRRDPRRQYLFLPPESDATAPPADAPQLVRFWHRKFTEIRRARAQQLFTLASRAVNEDQPTRAYQWLHEVLREDPEHAETRKILSYRPFGDPRRSPVRNARARPARLPHPQFGWRPGRYWRIETPHYRITTNHSPQAGLRLAARLEELVSVWRQLFFRYWSGGKALAARWGGGPALEKDRPHNVVLFRSRDEYLAQLAQAEPQIALSVGYYLDRKRTAYFYVGEDENLANSFHEATHQLFHERPSVVSPVGEARNFWIVEGAALYMESLARRAGYYTAGGFDANRLQYARYHALNQEFYLPIEKLVAYGRPALQQDDNIRRLYSQAAGLASFLMDYDGGRYRQAMVDYLRLVYQGRDRQTTLADLCQTPYAELDAQYRQFLNVSDADLEHLRPPEEVSKLALGHTAVTDQGLARLAGYTQLEWLDLASDHITDAGLAHLQSARRLKQLNLEQTPITDRSLDWVGSLSDLEELDLSATRITDAGLKRLAGLSRLKALWLTGDRVNDAGLAPLGNLKRLELLEVSGTDVTPESLRRLEATLPSLGSGNRPR